MKRIIFASLLAVVFALFSACSDNAKTAKTSAEKAEKPAPTLGDVRTGISTDSLVALLGKPRIKTELGFGVSRWYYSDTSFVAVMDDTVSNVVLSVAAAEKEIRDLFQ